jgi:hypothetical protein
MNKMILNVAKVAATTAFLALSSNVYALAFANGGFEGGSMNTNEHNSIVPPGWTTTSGTPDTFNGNTNFASYTWAPSSTGGQFLHGIGWQPTWTESALQIGLDGLVIGKVYEISFEQSISRSIWSETGGFWRIKFGTEIHDSAHMDIPEYGVFEGWDWQTMMFTATSTIQTLEVIAWSDTNGLRTDIGIDSFYLGEPGQNPDNPNNNNVPEPASLALMGLGLAGLAGLRRRKLV